jgi:dTDP-4-amino-4,6-dideoxygalactose transaminase
MGLRVSQIDPITFAPWPFFDREETEAATEVFSSGNVNYWTGKRCRGFEDKFGDYVGSEYAIALANGTLALDLALNALGIGRGDEVIVTPRTFIASVSTVVNAGAKPIFADVDRDSGNITPQTIEAVITDKTRAIIPVHLAGWPCDMPAIMDLAKANDCFVVEDCAQAHGAAIGGRSVGSFGDVGAWSYCQDKIMSTGGEGGMVTTDDKALWTKMWSYKDHGKSWEAVYERDHAPGYRWLHESFGTNWRMLEVQAAIGLSQLQKLPSWLERRRKLAASIRDMLAPFAHAIRCPEPSEPFRHAHYRQYAYVMQEGLNDGWTRDRIIAEATGQGLPLFHGSCSEVYMEAAFDGTGLRPDKRLPIASELGTTSLMFLTHPTITDVQMEQFLGRMESLLKLAVR